MRNKTEQVEEDNPLSVQNLSFSTPTVSSTMIEIKIQAKTKDKIVRRLGDILAPLSRESNLNKRYHFKNHAMKCFLFANSNQN